MRKVSCALLGAVALASLMCGTSAQAAGVVVYDTIGSTTNIDQQTGNNYYYIGDTLNLGAGGGTLQTVEVVFGTASSQNGVPFTYTPNIKLDLYGSAADANAQTNLLGSAIVNNVTFTNDGVVDPLKGYNYENEQVLTFDFTSQNITLPASLVIAYHDTPSLDSNGSVNGANGLSVGLVANPLANGYFDTYPNGSPSDLQPTAGYQIQARVTAAPTPAAAFGGMVLTGMLALARRRR